MRRHDLFEPDVLISQLWGDGSRRSAALSSEKRLMLAVLRDALDCYQKYVFAYDRVGRELFNEAAAWIACTDANGLFSFQNISETLDIEPEYFRRGLAEWQTRHQLAQLTAPLAASPLAPSSLATSPLAASPRAASSLAASPLAAPGMSAPGAVLTRTARQAR
jgi:hypothetical protein